MIENAERLQSGQYRARGILKSEYWKDGPAYRRGEVTTTEYEESCDAAFDLLKGCHLFRRKRRRLDGPDEAFGGVEQNRWYLSVPDLTVTLGGNEKRRTVILRPVTPWDKIWPNQMSMPVPQPVYDPRLLGWAGFGLLGVSFETFFDVYFHKTELRIFDEGDGVQRIESVRRIDAGSARVLTLWCDKKQGWQPVRSSIRWVYDDKLRPGGQPEPTSETEQSWERHADVWVLKSLSLWDLDGTTRTNLQMAFDWETVNEPIPSDTFNWKAWRVPLDYQNIEDWRLGGRHKIVITDDRVPPHEIELTRPIDAPKKSSGRYWLLLLNVAVVSAVCGCIVQRLMARKRHR